MGILKKIVEFLSDNAGHAPKDWDDEFSMEKYEAAGKVQVYGLGHSTLISKKSGERHQLSVKENHIDDIYAREFWLESPKGEKTIVYFDDILRLLKSGKYRLTGAKWYYKQ